VNYELEKGQFSSPARFLSISNPTFNWLFFCSIQEFPGSSTLTEYDYSRTTSSHLLARSPTQNQTAQQIQGTGFKTVTKWVDTIETNHIIIMV
jgi:hypothetical protein